MKQLLTFFAIIACVLVVIAFVVQNHNTSQQLAGSHPAAAEQSVSDQSSAADAGSGQTPAATTPVKTIEASAADIVEPAVAEPAPSTTPVISAVPQTVYHAVPAKSAEVSEIGSNDKHADYKLRVEFSGWGASIYNVYLTDYQQDTDDTDPYLVQTVQQFSNSAGDQSYVFPFAAYQITINGQTLSLSDIPWQNTSPGEYEITIADAENKPAVKITRAYTIATGEAGYSIVCKQNIENLTGAPLSVVWDQFAQGDLVSKGAYEKLRDQRSIIAGYYDTDYDPQKLRVVTESTYKRRAELLDIWDELKNETNNAVEFWPNPELPPKRELVWLASTNRYFAAAVHRVMPATAPNPLPSYAPNLDSIFPNIKQSTYGTTAGEEDNRCVMLRIATDTITIKPYTAANLDVALYAGPRSIDLFNKYPYKTLDLTKIIKYDLGCTLCTFQPVARFLLGFLKVIHAITFNCSIAIIVLVLTVRLILHPLTKKSQINMMKMSKMMQTLQPETEKLKLKYKNDQATLNKEMMALYKEKGVNPANFLGCLPMLIQMPIWVALYAMLYFAIELRTEPAFYGIFQIISGGNWGFLSDLSSPDRIYTFTNHPITLNFPLLNSLDFSTFNILPILMGIMYFLQQQLMTPPATNEQAAQQQKMMKFMMLLFPVFLYSAPSGLTLYILASSGAGIIDSYIVRRHVKRMEEDGTLFEKKPPKPGGFIERMQKFAASRQQMIEQQQKQRKSGDFASTQHTKSRKKK